ncbi:hypothetical protein ACET8S_17630 [Aeromonas veronii]
MSIYSHKYGHYKKFIFIIILLIPCFSHAKNSSKTEVVHGHQIAITMAPVISGAVETLPVTINQPPSYTDQDGDSLVDWQYVWVVDNVEQGPAASFNNNWPSVSFVPPVGSGGKDLKLKVTAIANSQTSYPPETAVSIPSFSNSVNIVPATISFSQSEITAHVRSGVSRGIQVGQYIVTNYHINSYGRDLVWTISGPDAQYYSRASESSEWINLSARSYNNPTDQNGDGIYEATISVRDPKTNAQAAIRFISHILP